MRFGFVLAVLARLNIFVGLAMASALLFSWQDGWRDAVPIVQAVVITLAVSGIGALIFRTPKEDITHREGMLIVTLGWAMAGLFGALPFFLADMLGPKTLANFINCFFEAISGFTTTGASVLGQTVMIESVGRGLLFWRSLTHWLGGMGIIVLAVAILPLIGVGGQQLFHAEAPGPTKEKLFPRIRETAATLWGVYILLSAVETILLMGAGLDLFEALCQTFGTMATGGFSTRNASIGAFGSGLVDTIIIVFMFLAGANFILHYLALTGRIRSYWENSEFRYYLGIILLCTAGMTAWLFFGGVSGSILEALRYGAFQTVSIITTTGFATTDFELWPIVLQLALLLFMFIGGCAKSTGGSIKVVRIALLFKYAYRELFRMVHPRAFAAVKFQGKVVHKDILESVAGFFILYMALFVAATMVMAGMGLDIITAASSVAATLGNIGPGLGEVGPAENYFLIPTAGKVLLSFCMILGRLEIYTVIVLFTPEFWKK